MAKNKKFTMDNLKEALIQNNTKMKQWVEAQISKLNIIDLQWVESLPVSEISTSTIYLLKSDLSTVTNNLYDEYVYNIDTGWEILGQVDVGSIDLSNYYNKQEIDDLLKDIGTEPYTESEITAIINEIWS